MALARFNRTKEYLMLTTIDTAVTFSEVRLSTTDSKVKLRLNQCDRCAALVQPSSRLQHKRFHENLRAVAKETGLARR
jgi:hypothetical protein